MPVAIGANKARLSGSESRRETILFTVPPQEK